MKAITLIAAVLLIIGGLNWGLVGAFGFDLVAALFGEMSVLSRLVYLLVGAAAVLQIFTLKAISRVRFAHAATAGAAVALSAVLIAPADLEAGTKRDKDIVDVAVAAGDFDTLVTAVKAAELAETLKGPGPFTVFAPTDAAFEKLPKGTLEALLEDKDKLTSILTFHVVSGETESADIVRANGASPETVNGQSLDIEVRDGKVYVNDAQVVTADIQASNGIVHVIDTVLMPQ